MSQYASGTEVPADRSRAEIERTLQRYGADMFAYASSPVEAMIAFRMRGRHLKIRVPLPATGSFRLTPQGRERTERQQAEQRDQEVRRRWRVLTLLVKSTLEAVESGVVDFDTAFMGFLMLPDGSTVGEWAEPQLEEIYERREMPELLPGLERPALKAIR